MAEHLLLNSKTRSAIYGDIKASLTPREYRFLSHLVEAGGEPVSTVEMAVALFGDPLLIGNLGALVFNLRAKFGEDVVQTVRFSGYRVSVYDECPACGRPWRSR